MEAILKGLDSIEVIMDDILIHGKDLPDHDAKLAAALERIDKSGLKLNHANCQFS